MLIFDSVLLVPGLTEAQSSPVKPLTIEQIFMPGAITGRGPETMEWSPDGSRLSFVQRDDKGEQGELWYVDEVLPEAAFEGQEVFGIDAEAGSLPKFCTQVRVFEMDQVPDRGRDGKNDLVCLDRFGFLAFLSLRLS
jgi:hypothetical protein